MNNKRFPYIFAFLLFCVASSKHIIIYNEELLVSGTFLAFVIYVTIYFGDTIKQSLDESRNAILQELQTLFVHKKDSAFLLKDMHEKVPSIFSSLSSVQQFTLDTASQIGILSTKALKSAYNQQIQRRCLEFTTASQPLFTTYQQAMAESHLPLVLVKSQKESATSGKGHLKQTAKKAVALLQQIKN